MAISDTIPTYRQLNPAGFFCPDAYLIPEGEAFEFDGEPNEHMEPLNEPAKKRLVELFKKMNAAAEAAAAANGRIFTSGPKPLDVLVAEATQDARRPELIPGDGGLPLTTKNITGDAHVKPIKLSQGQAVRRNRNARVQEAS